MFLTWSEASSLMAEAVELASAGKPGAAKRMAKAQRLMRQLERIRARPDDETPISDVNDEQ